EVVVPSVMATMLVSGPAHPLAACQPGGRAGARYPGSCPRAAQLVGRTCRLKFALTTSAKDVYSAATAVATPRYPPILFHSVAGWAAHAPPASPTNVAVSRMKTACTARVPPSEAMNM